MEVIQRQTRYLRAQRRALAWRLARIYPAHYVPHSKSLEQRLDEFRAQQLPDDRNDDPHFAERLAHHDEPAPLPAARAVRLTGPAAGVVVAAQRRDCRPLAGGVRVRSA